MKESKSMTRLSGKVEKGWGSEQIWVTNEHYCSKFLHFNQFAKFSMHFHKEKVETWFVVSGRFIVDTIDLTDASKHSVTLLPNDVYHIDPMQPHRLYCLEAGTILEVSTPDSVEDNYRILPGNSQK
jgi:mannose-6-phosphate isomerase-like protein (cupin superfamily)